MTTLTEMHILNPKIMWIQLRWSDAHRRLRFSGGILRECYNDKRNKWHIREMSKDLHSHANDRMAGEIVGKMKDGTKDRFLDCKYHSKG